MPPGGLRNMQGRHQVQRHDGVAEARRGGRGFSQRRAPGVVDHDVEAAVALDHAVDHAPHLIGHAHVAGHELGCASAMRRQGLRLAAATDHDTTPGFEQGFGNRLADALGPACDQSHLPA
ncbi:hypothetical protein D3C72_2126360 [compost metagenome]